MKQTTVNDCSIIDIRRYSDNRGYLSVIEGSIDIPFEIKRIYYLYMVRKHREERMHTRCYSN